MGSMDPFKQKKDKLKFEVKEVLLCMGIQLRLGLMERDSLVPRPFLLMRVPDGLAE